MASSTSNTRKPASDAPRRRILQNVLLVWVDANIKPDDNDSQHTQEQLRSVVNDVTIFTEPQACVEFVEGIQAEKVLVVTSGSLGQDLVPRIHSMAKLDSIFIFCGNETRYKQLAEAWPKIKGVYTRIKSICEALQAAVKQNNQDSIPISFSKSSENGSRTNLNQLEPSFMYTQLFKDVLLNMEHQEQSQQDLVVYCKDTYAGNPKELQIIGDFERNYRSNKAIWWYTRECFTYQMLNRALRLLEADIIVNMGFLLSDIHHQIEQLHKDQVSQYNGTCFTVYRGQGLSSGDFKKLQNTQDGLMSFNSFLSTGKKRDFSFHFAEKASKQLNTVGILFVMTIDPKIMKTPFADIEQINYYKEPEILFSMHTVFRVGQIKDVDKKGKLVEVQLTLTGENDEQLLQLTNQLDKELLKGGTGWHQLGQILIKVSQMDKAEELYLTLLGKTSNQGHEALYYHQLGYIKDQQGDYKEAIRYYEQAIDIRQTILPAKHHLLAGSYDNIGLVYSHMGEYSKALSYNEKALNIRQATLDADHSDLANSYNNIGTVYSHMGEYSKALSYYEKDLEINQKNLPGNHPDLAGSYSNIGEVYDSMGEYSKALSFYEKTLAIEQKALPANHPDLANSHDSIGEVYRQMGEYLQALSYYEKALEIRQKTLPANHPSLANSYNNIGAVYYHMKEYSKALSFYEKALNIRQATLDADHPDLANSYNIIGLVYHHMGEYSKALSYYEKALAIQQKTFPENHPDVANSYNSIGGVYQYMGEYSKALSYNEKALDILQKTLPANHPRLANSYHNTGWVYERMEEYSKALSSFEKVLAIKQKTLPANHPDLANFYTEIGLAYYKMGEYSKALSAFQRALDIGEHSLPPNDSSLLNVRELIEIAKKKL